MKILESKFVQGFIKMANDGYLQGWHERNGGNLSYRLKPEEVEMIRPRLNAPGEWIPILKTSSLCPQIRQTVSLSQAWQPFPSEMPTSTRSRMSIHLPLTEMQTALQEQRFW